jgi:translation initiation factor eIF-2B subunit delta
MLAKEHRVPVVACVETYKFGERVVLDGVAANELGRTEGVWEVPGQQPKVAGPNLTPLNFLYDLTPPSLITAVCTEVSQAGNAEA